MMITSIYRRCNTILFCLWYFSKQSQQSVSYFHYFSELSLQTIWSLLLHIWYLRLISSCISSSCSHASLHHSQYYSYCFCFAHFYIAKKGLRVFCAFMLSEKQKTKKTSQLPPTLLPWHLLHFFWPLREASMDEMRTQIESIWNYAIKMWKFGARYDCKVLQRAK